MTLDLDFSDVAAMLDDFTLGSPTRTVSHFCVYVPSIYYFWVVF